MRSKKKIVYVGLAADILHEGHINILERSKKLGKVIVGLLTDEAISTYKKLPYLNYKQREIVLKNMKSVYKVIPQNTLSYVDNLNLLKPDFVVHGDDWKKGVQKKTRSDVIKTLKKWSGKLIEPKYTSGVSSTDIRKKILEVGTTPEIRKSRLKRFLKKNKNISKEEVKIFNWRENEAEKLNVPPNHIVEDRDIKRLKKTLVSKKYDEFRWIIKKESSRKGFMENFT